MAAFTSTTADDLAHAQIGAALLPAAFVVDTLTDSPELPGNGERHLLRLEAPNAPLPAYTIRREPEGHLEVCAVHGEHPGHETLDDLGQFSTIAGVLGGIGDHLQAFRSKVSGLALASA